MNGTNDVEESAAVLNFLRRVSFLYLLKVSLDIMSDLKFVNIIEEAILPDTILSIITALVLRATILLSRRVLNELHLVLVDTATSRGVLLVITLHIEVRTLI